MSTPPTAVDVGVFCGVVIVCTIIIVILVLWSYLHREDYIKKYIHRQACHTFFCGYTVEQIIHQHLLDNLGRFLDMDLSSVTSILMMILMHDYETARLVRRRFNGSNGEYWHAWVEFRYFGTWYTLDPEWYAELVAKRDRSDSRGDISETQVYTHSQFWSLPSCQQIYRKLHHPSSSYLFFELYNIANSERFANAPNFDEQYGCEFKPLWFNGNRVVSCEVVNCLIQHRDYREPPVHAVLAGIYGETYDYFRNHPMEDDYEYDDF